jgi:Family of unknown function (DUF6807)
LETPAELVRVVSRILSTALAERLLAHRTPLLVDNRMRINTKPHSCPSAVRSVRRLAYASARVVLVMLSVWLAVCDRNAAAEESAAEVKFATGDGRLTVAIDGVPVAMYCYQDEQIPRPYFAHVRSASGIQVTRNHPPVAGQDVVDHDTFHPGIWLSFGDLSGSDFWRNQSRVEQVEFVEPPRDGQGQGSFAVRNQYFDQSDPTRVICEETARYTFVPRPAGYLILWDSTFSSDKEFTFGDQEEMGLGIRVATPLRVGTKNDVDLPPGGGTITNSQGSKNEAEVWGKTADWCDYSGTIAGQSVGVTIFCHPENFRPSWFHARDYGLIEANPFGRQAFGKGDKSVIVVQPGDTLRLRFGILIHNGPAGSQPDLAAEFEDYKQLAGN